MSSEQFLETFRNRRHFCQSLLDLSRQQAEWINKDDTMQLLTVLGQKQRVLEEMDQHKRASEKVYLDWQQRKDSLPPNQREDCEHLLAETEALIEQLLELERAGTESLIEKRDKTQRQLETVVQGSQVHAAYRDSMPVSTSRHLDIGR